MRESGPEQPRSRHEDQYDRLPAPNADAAWYYLEPEEAAAEIRGRVAFWKGVEVTA